MLFPSGRSDKTEGYRSTEHGVRKDSVLFGGNFSSAANLCLLYIFYIYFIFNKRNHPPRGLPKTGGHGILQYIIVEK